MEVLRFIFSEELQLQDPQGLLCKVLLVLACVLWLKALPQLRRIRVSLDKVSRKDDDHRKHFRSTLVERMASSEHINHALDHLLQQLGCDRAYVFQYHNGGENVAGIPFAKCSVTHERVRGGIEPRIIAWQNLPVSLFSSLTCALAERREFYLNGATDCNSCNSQLAKVFGTLSLYIVGLYSFDGLPVGFVGIDYCYQQRKLSAGEISTLKAASFKVCGLLLSERGER